MVGLDSMVRHFNSSQYSSATSDHREGKVEWPAAVIMNFMYACAAIRKWGTPALRTTLNKQRESASWAVDKTNQDNRARTARAKKGGRRSNPDEPREGAEPDDGWVWAEFQIGLQKERARAQVRQKTTEWLGQVEAAN